MFNAMPEVLEDLKLGKMVIVVDDEDRENEGDLIMAAQFITPPAINFMATHAKGLICMPMEGSRLDALELEPMAKESETPFGTDWVISVDARYGITTGISAFDRARTVQVLIDAKTTPKDLVRPGHIFPLRAKEGGALRRAGHTEACVDLMRLAGLHPAGVICEIMSQDGSMARVPQLIEFAKAHGLKICTIADLIEYRRRSEKLIRKELTTKLATEYGEFDLAVYESTIDHRFHLALVMGDLSNGECLVRVHSECLTGDVFKSQRCDCGPQLDAALRMIAREGRGVLVYMRQEGRGVGLINKLKAYSLQDQGMDTVEANAALGFKPDLRDYGIGAQILVDIGVRRLRLLTNNPKKIVGLEGYGLQVIERVPLEVAPNQVNRKYLKAKKEKLGHLLSS